MPLDYKLLFFHARLLFIVAAQAISLRNAASCLSTHKHFYDAFVLQPTPRPTRHVDDRVHIIQADARTLSPAKLQDYVPEGQFDTVLSDMLHFTR